MHWWFRVFLLLRALRPLRILSLSPGMRGVVWDVARGWKKFLAGVILLFSFMFLFASLGVQVGQWAWQWAWHKVVRFIQPLPPSFLQVVTPSAPRGSAMTRRSGVRLRIARESFTSQCGHLASISLDRPPGPPSSSLESGRYGLVVSHAT